MRRVEERVLKFALAAKFAQCDSVWYKVTEATGQKNVFFFSKGEAFGIISRREWRWSERDYFPPRPRRGLIDAILKLIWCAQCFCFALVLRSTEKSRAIGNKLPVPLYPSTKGSRVTSRLRGRMEQPSSSGLSLHFLASRGFGGRMSDRATRSQTRERRARRPSARSAISFLCSARTETREQREQQNIGFTAIGFRRLD